MRMQTINNDQKKLIHIAKRELGMDDDTYREMLRNIGGVGSSKELSAARFSRIMEHLEKCGFRYRPTKPIRRANFNAYLKKWTGAAGNNRPDMATPAQLAKIEESWEALPWYWMRGDRSDKHKALRGFVGKLTGVSDLRFLTFIQAGNIIEAIKSIAARGPGSSSPLPQARGNR